MLKENFAAFPNVEGRLCKILQQCQLTYRVSLKKGNFSDFCLISVLEVEFYFFTCDLESEFGARFI